MAAPYATTCAACGATGDLHEHHLVPRVHGGHLLPTVMICLGCHSKVHGRVFDVRHSELTRAGLAKAKARGVKLGNPNLKPGDFSGLAHAARQARTARAGERAEDVMHYVAAAQKAGCNSLGSIARALMARGIETAGGRTNWGAEQVRRVLLHVKRMGLD